MIQGLAFAMSTSDTPQSLAVVDVEKARAIGIEADDFLREMFNGFRHHYADAAVSIRAHLDNGEHKDAKMFAHSIVGIAGTLGAEQVCAAARALDRSLTGDVDVDGAERALDDFGASLSRLIAYIDEHYPTHTVV